MSELPAAMHITQVGTGPHRVVFLHGLYGQAKNFTQIAKALGGIATCLLFDVPNHGRSAWTEEFSYPLIADLIADELSERGAFAHPVILIGHSMGGKLAMRLTLDHPELVQSLIVVDISPASSAGADAFQPYTTAMLSIDLSSLRQRADADRALKLAVPDDEVRSFLLQNLHHRPTPTKGEERWYWQPNLKLLGESLGTIAGWDDPGTDWDGPVLWVRGERSNYVRSEHAQAMANLFPNYQLVTIPGAGHWVHADQPEVFTALLRQFIVAQPVE